MKKIIALLTVIAIITTSSFAQKVIKFKTMDGKKAKVTLPGKLFSTLKEKSGGKQEYYVDFDSKNMQISIAMVTYSEKGYLGSDVTYCKYADIDARFLANAPMQGNDNNGILENPNFYSYNLSAKNKFPLKSNNSFTGVESSSETSSVAIRFADAETANTFMNEVKQKLQL